VTSTRARFTRLVLAALLSGLGAGRAAADEGSFENAPAGSSVKELDSALDRSVREEDRRKILFPFLKNAIQKLPPFFADTEVTLNFRTYGLPLKTSTGERAYAWTAGGKLGFRSGWLADTLQVGFGLYGSYAIVQDDPDVLTGLLREGGVGYTVPGEAFVKLRWRDYEGTFYRHELDLPYVNKQDSRMTPNSFQGAILRGKHVEVPGADLANWVAGWITDIRPRAADDFISMGERAGAVGSNAGMAVLGAQFEPYKGTSLGFYNYWVPDVLSIHYLATDVLRDLGGGWGFRTQWQFTLQTDGGGTDLLGKSFKTWVFGGRAAFSKSGVTAWLGFSITDDEEDIRSPYGTYAGFMSMMQSDFNSAGEKAALFGISYDFSHWEIQGLSAFMQLGVGRGAKIPDLGLSGLDETSLDFTVDYRFQSSRLKGLWIRARGSFSAIDAPGRDNAHQARFIINYDLPLL
jgi:hypothetical protein